MVAVSLKKVFFKQKTAYEILRPVTGVQTCALPISPSKRTQTYGAELFGQMRFFHHLTFNLQANKYSITDKPIRAVAKPIQEAMMHRFILVHHYYLYNYYE